MESGKMKKIGKWALIIIAIVCGLVVLSLSLGIVINEVVREWTGNREKKEKGINFMLNGEGCSYYYNISEKELREKIKNELRFVSEGRFKNIIKENQRTEERRKNPNIVQEIRTDERERVDEQCNILEDRILKILN